MVTMQRASELTIKDIEAELLKIRPNWIPGAELRELALLFAVLKVGQGLQKLVWFTGYEATFVVRMIRELQQHGKLYTGLSVQFVLTQCPGCEHLIEKVTGAPVAPKPALALAPKPKEITMSTKSEPETVETAEPKKNCWCGREMKHKGHHRGQGVNGTSKREKAKIVAALTVTEKRQSELKPIAPAAGALKRPCGWAAGHSRSLPMT
jgi:hypothetical protein